MGKKLFQLIYFSQLTLTFFVTEQTVFFFKVKSTDDIVRDEKLRQNAISKAW